MDAIVTSRRLMTVEEFLAWDAGGKRWELVDGEPREPAYLESGRLELDSVGFACPLESVYATSHLATS